MKYNGLVLASFPDPAQLSVACSTEEWGFKHQGTPYNQIPFLQKVEISDFWGFHKYSETVQHTENIVCSRCFQR